MARDDHQTSILINKCYCHMLPTQMRDTSDANNDEDDNNNNYNNNDNDECKDDDIDNHNDDNHGGGDIHLELVSSLYQQIDRHGDPMKMGVQTIDMVIDQEKSMQNQLINKLTRRPQC